MAHPQGKAPPRRASRALEACAAAVLALGLPIAACAQQPTDQVPLEDIPKVEGGPGATTVPPAGEPSPPPSNAEATTAISPPSPAGTVSSWRQHTDRTSIRIASPHGADELMGAEVVDPSGQLVGTIDDLLVDTDGMVRKAVLTAAAGAEPLPAEASIIDLASLKARPEGQGFTLEAPPP